jgi:hypothetical protein
LDIANRKKGTILAGNYFVEPVEDALISLKLDDNHYSRPRELITSLERNFAKYQAWKVSIAKPFKYSEKPISFWENQSKALKFSYDPQTNRVTIIIRRPMKKIEMSSMLCYTLGFKEETLGPGIHVAPLPPDPKGGKHMFFVYCNLVYPSLVGDTRAPLLKMVAPKGRYGTIQVAEFPQSQYMPVALKRFNEIEINITGADGEPINFSFGTIYCKLHFVRKV